MTEEEFVEIIARGREQPSVEFKGPGAGSGKHLFAKVVRCCFGNGSPARWRLCHYWSRRR